MCSVVIYIYIYMYIKGYGKCYNVNCTFSAFYVSRKMFYAMLARYLQQIINVISDMARYCISFTYCINGENENLFGRVFYFFGLSSYRVIELLIKIKHGAVRLHMCLGLYVNCYFSDFYHNLTVPTIFNNNS
jgi:hypothetical protein